MNTKIFSVVFDAAEAKRAPAHKKMLCLKEDDKTEFNHVLETMVSSYIFIYILVHLYILLILNVFSMNYY